MNTLNEDTTVLVRTPRLCACCGYRYGTHGCTVGDCMLGMRSLSEQFDPERYIAEQEQFLGAVTPFAEIADAPKTAVGSARALITSETSLSLHDLEVYMLDEGFEAKEVHDAVAHLVLVGFCDIDDASALTLATPKVKPEPVIEVPRSWFWRLASLFTGGR